MAAVEHWVGVRDEGLTGAPLDGDGFPSGPFSFIRGLAGLAYTVMSRRRSDSMVHSRSRGISGGRDRTHGLVIPKQPERYGDQRAVAASTC